MKEIFKVCIFVQFSKLELIAFWKGNFYIYHFRRITPTIGNVCFLFQRSVLILIFFFTSPQNEASPRATANKSCSSLRKYIIDTKQCFYVNEYYHSSLLSQECLEFLMVLVQFFNFQIFSSYPENGLLPQDFK